MYLRKPLFERSVSRWTRPFALLLLVVGVAACSSEAPSEEAATAEPMAEAPAAAPASGPRVFFVEPMDGASVKSPVRLVFGSANYQIAPVPEGTVEVARPAMGHHHVGVDIDCLAPGAEIPKANPWVHHGSGATEMEMQLTPGSHKLTLQIGDDRHMTSAGLCSTITVNVTP